MALFSYQAVNEQGKKIKGILHAASRKEAHFLLSQQKICVNSLDQFPEQQREASLKKKEILSFTRETAKLLKAGLPLYETILSLEEKYRNSHLQQTLLDLAEQLKEGHSFSEALRKHPKNFDFLYCKMVANAEKTGTLDQTLEELSKLLERGEKLKSQFLSALIYPAFLFGFGLLVIVVLLFYIIPSLFELFEGRPLHPLTRCVLSCSHFVLSHTYAMGFFFASFIVVLLLLFMSPRAKQKLQKIFLRLPLVKSLMLKVGFVRYFRTLSVLIQGGVPLLEALQLARNVMQHPLLNQQMQEAERRVKEGWLLSQHLEKSSLVPQWVCRMVGVAEKTGDLQNMLRHIADVYEEDLEKNLAQITTFLQPLLLLTLGVVVGFVVLSVLIPLTDVSSFLST